MSEKQHPWAWACWNNMSPEKMNTKYMAKIAPYMQNLIILNMLMETEMGFEVETLQ